MAPGALPPLPEHRHARQQGLVLFRWLGWIEAEGLRLTGDRWHERFNTVAGSRSIAFCTLLVAIAAVFGICAERASGDAGFRPPAARRIVTKKSVTVGLVAPAGAKRVTVRLNGKPRTYDVPDHDRIEITLRRLCRVAGPNTLPTSLQRLTARSPTTPHGLPRAAAKASCSPQPLPPAGTVRSGARVPLHTYKARTSRIRTNGDACA